MFESSTRTLLCGDLFTHAGADAAAADGVGGADARRRRCARPCRRASRSTCTRGGSSNKLAATEPRTLALMHGSSYRGDGAKLAASLRRRARRLSRTARPRATFRRRWRRRTPSWYARSRRGRTTRPPRRPSSAAASRRASGSTACATCATRTAPRDLVQAVLLAVLQAARAGRIADPDRVDRFMLGTSRNVAQRMRETRRAQRRRRGAGGDRRARPKPLERIDAAALSRCMGALDDRGRRVVMLSFNDERSAEEIAALLAISPVNVRVLRHRAIAALRRCLDADRRRRMHDAARTRSPGRRWSTTGRAI